MKAKCMQECWWATTLILRQGNRPLRQVLVVWLPGEPSAPQQLLAECSTYRERCGCHTPGMACHQQTVESSCMCLNISGGTSGCSRRAQRVYRRSRRWQRRSGQSERLAVCIEDTHHSGTACRIRPDILRFSEMTALAQMVAPLVLALVAAPHTDEHTPLPVRQCAVWTLAESYRNGFQPLQRPLGTCRERSAETEAGTALQQSSPSPLPSSCSPWSRRSHWPADVSAHSTRPSTPPGGCRRWTIARTSPLGRAASGQPASAPQHHRPSPVHPKGCRIWSYFWAPKLSAALGSSLETASARWAASFCSCGEVELAPSWPHSISLHSLKGAPPLLLEDVWAHRRWQTSFLTQQLVHGNSAQSGSVTAFNVNQSSKTISTRPYVT